MKLFAMSTVALIALVAACSGCATYKPLVLRPTVHVAEVRNATASNITTQTDLVGNDSNATAVTNTTAVLDAGPVETGFTNASVDYSGFGNGKTTSKMTLFVYYMKSTVDQSNATLGSLISVFTPETLSVIYSNPENDPPTTAAASGIASWAVPVGTDLSTIKLRCIAAAQRYNQTHSHLEITDIRIQ